MYVDNLLKSMDTIVKARSLYRESVKHFVNSGFQLTKWSSNAATFIKEILLDERSPTITVISDTKTSAYVHGAMGLE